MTLSPCVTCSLITQALPESFLEARQCARRGDCICEYNTVPPLDCPQADGAVRRVRRGLNVTVPDAILPCCSCMKHFMAMPLTLLVPVILKYSKYLMLTDFGPNVNVKVLTDTDGVPRTYDVLSAAKKRSPLRARDCAFHRDLLTVYKGFYL